MRNFNLLFVLSALCLFSCQSPSKLIETGQYESAFYSIIKNNNPQRINKWNDELRLAFNKLQSNNHEKLEKLYLAESENKWPHIVTALERGIFREEQILKMISSNTIKENQENFTFYPQWSNQIEVALENAAAYYYERMSAAKIAGDNGDKSSYRTAYRLAERTRRYVDDFKEVIEMQKELKILGTDYLLLFPDIHADPQAGEIIWNNYAKRQGFPLKGEWTEIYIEESAMPRLDQFLRMGIDNISIGGDYEHSETCSNSKKVKCGTKIEKVWCDSDSAYVDREVDIFETISVTVTNTTQEKSSSFYLDLALIEKGSSTSIAHARNLVCNNWSNTYGSSFGDFRAEDASCSQQAGSWSPFPSDEYMLSGLSDSVPFYLRRFMKKEVGVELAKQRRRGWWF